MLKLARRIFALGLLFSAVVSHAQTIAAGMTGNVEDEQGKSIRAVTIEATNVAAGTQFVAATNDRGACRFAALPIGRYVIRFSLPGFQDAEIRGVDLHVGQERRADIRLVSLNQKSEITVSGSLSPLDAQTSSSRYPPARRAVLLRRGPQERIRQRCQPTRRRGCEVVPLAPGSAASIEGSACTYKTELNTFANCGTLPRYSAPRPNSNSNGSRPRRLAKLAESPI